MSLSPGTRLGPYEVLAPLGAGGMGEVYRARDTRLSRDVAIKVLPAHLSAQPEVRARFEREAQTISGLNHPNICTLYDIGRAGETDFLVMELVEGDTLAARLERGPLPIEDCLRIGIEVAEALDRAHKAGVVHRDLKPGNVMLARTGAKLMDFGLARPTGMAGGTSGSGSAAFTHSPTMAQPLTAEGTIVGTFLYMSPEQLEGKEADARSDLWALGCVLYEMATGQRAFQGSTQASLISAIMRDQPRGMSDLIPLTPPAFERCVRQCLAKDPDARWQSAGDLKRELEWIRDAGSAAGVAAPVKARRRRREGLAWSVAGLALAAAAAASLLAPKPGPVAPPLHASLLPPAGVQFSSSTDHPLPLAISPDGSLLAYCGRKGEAPDMLWIRSLAAEDARPLPGTEDAQGPFFSPDGRSIGFFSQGKMKRVDISGGPVITVVENLDPRGATWNDKGLVLFSGGSLGPLSKVLADGGAVATATVLDSTLGESTHRYPWFLPDGRHFLYLARRAGAGPGESPIIWAGDLQSRERKKVVEVASNLVYASGHLLFVRGGVLVAQRFDPGSLALSGSAVPVVDDVRMDERFSRGVFAASQSGVLVGMTGRDRTRTQLWWLDREGKKVASVGEPADYTYGGTPMISPDGRRAAMPIANRERGISDAWIVDLGTGLRRRLTVDMFDHPGCCWVGDTRIAVNTGAAGGFGVEVMAGDGSRSDKLFTGADYAWPVSASPDGKTLLVTGAGDSSASVNDVTMFSLVDRTRATFLSGKANLGSGQFSPDGRWVAYVSEESGRNEVYVAAFPSSGGKWQVSQDGGAEPRWRRDGRELYYVDGENYVVAIEVPSSGAGFETGASRRLFQFHGAGGSWRYDVSLDGERFLVTVPVDEGVSSVTVITDWTRKMTP